MCAHALYLEIALWNASIVVMVAFGAHYVKGIPVSEEYSWLALYSRGKCRNYIKKHTGGTNFCKKKIVSIEGDMCRKTLSYDKVIITGSLCMYLHTFIE